jgi:pimeloyl-ACP methyl ester carboxylesterase
MTGARERMLAGSPLSAHTYEIAGTTTQVLEGGDGPPVVLLHGAIECGGVVWTPAVSGLVGDYRLIVPDVPGLGESTPMSRTDPDTFSAWLRGLLDRVGVGKPTLVAHSLVGTLTARFAARHSSLLSRLLIYASPGVVRYRMPLGLRYRALRFAVRPTARNFERFQRFALLDRDSTRERDPEWFDAFSEYTMARAHAPEVKATMGRLFTTQAKEISRDELDRIDVPTALLWGRDDRMVPLRMAEAAAARLHWPLFTVEGAAHVPHIEQPQLFVDVLRAACASD